MANDTPPVPQPQQTAPAQAPPDVQGPQTNPDQPLAQTGDQQQPAAPGAAAAGPGAAALPPSRDNGVHGVLANVALGALQGAVVGAAKKAAKVPSEIGKGFKAYSAATPYGQRVQAAKLENQKTQQAMKLAEGKAMDEHQESVLRSNQLSMQNIGIGQENAARPEQLKQEAEGRRLTINQQYAQRDAAIRDVYETLEQNGVHIDTSHFAPGSPFANLTQDHATAIANGKQIPVPNGKSGDDSDLGFLSNAELANTILQHDANVISDYKIDPKTGEMTPVYKTLTAGHNTALDVVIQAGAANKKFDMLKNQWTSNENAKEGQQKLATGAADIKEKQAEAAEKQSAAALNDVYARQMGGGAGGAGNAPLPAIADAISKLPVQVQQHLQQYSPQIQGMLIRGAYGWIDPATFPTRLTKGGIGITRANAESEMLEINSNYSSNLHKDIVKAQTDPKTHQSIRSFNQFLVHAQELQKVSAGFQRTNSPWLNTPINEVENKGLGQPGVPEMLAAVEAARTEWTSFINSGYAPDKDTVDRANILMNDKSTLAQIMGVLGVMGTQAIGRLDQINEDFKTMTGVDYPNLVTPSGAAAAQSLGINVSGYQSGGTFSGGPGKTLSNNVVPPGAQPVIVNGKTIGYSTDGKTFTRFSGQ